MPLSVKDRILAALRDGPVYDGALALVVCGGNTTQYRRAIAELAGAKLITQDADKPAVWRLR